MIFFQHYWKKKKEISQYKLHIDAFIIRHSNRMISHPNLGKIELWVSVLNSLWCWNVRIQQQKECTIDVKLKAIIFHRIISIHVFIKLMVIIFVYEISSKKKRMDKNIFKWTKQHKNREWINNFSFLLLLIILNRKKNNRIFGSGMMWTYLMYKMNNLKYRVYIFRN